MKKILTSLFLAASMTLVAQTPETVFDLTTREAFNQCTQQALNGKSYSPWTFYSGYSGSYPQMYTYSLGQSGYDNALITPALELAGGNKYAVQFKPTLYMSYNAMGTNVKVWIGQGDDLSTYTLIGHVTDIMDTSYSGGTAQEFFFSLIEDTNLNIAFEGYGDNLILHNCKIVKYGPSTIPAAPSDFTLTPDPDGGNSLKISFTMPGTTVTGQPLENPTYTIYKGVQAIMTDVACAGGTFVEIPQNVAESGRINYSIVIKSGDEVSEKVTKETYVGLDTATPPTNVQVSMVDGKFVITWDAPVTGKEGTTLNPDKLKYVVCRYMDGNYNTNQEVMYKGDVTGTTYTDEFEYEGIHKVKYSVAALYATQKKPSAATFTEEKTIGSMNLPFNDSFSGATMNPLWDNVVTKYSATGTPQQQYYWQPREAVNINQNVGQNPSSFNIFPVDGDGGLLFYNSYAIQKNNECRLATPPISYHAGESPVLSFARWQAKQNGADKFYIQICSNYGEWQNIPEATYTSGGATEEGWHLENIRLNNYLPEGTTVYQVAFYAESAYGINMMIDDVRLFNQVEKDLSLDAFSVTEEVKVGNMIDFTVKVSNNGLNEVAASDYSIVIDHNYSIEIEVPELEAIPSLGSATYTFSVPATSLHILDVTDFEFSARVVYDGDQDLSNNASESMATKAVYSAGNGVEIIASEANEDGTYTIHWESAKDLTYTPVNISESFEDESFEEDSTGPFNGWTIIDLDNKAGSTWYTASGSIFNLAKNAGTPGQKDGKNVLGCTLLKNAQQDDWIISPMLNCKEGSTMDLSFLFGVKQNTSYGMKYEIEILYCTADEYSVLNPADNFTEQCGHGSYDYTSYNAVIPHDNKMHPLTFTGIPAEAKYVALHFISKGSYDMAMWVDKIEITEHDEMALKGYHVYSLTNGSRLNEEIIGADETSFTFAAAQPAEAPARVATFADGGHSVIVAAVYPDGEAQYKNSWDVMDNTTGVANVTVEEEGTAEYFNLQGMKMNGNLTPGIYIKRTNGSSSKIMVK